MGFAERVRQIRVSRGLSQDALVARMGGLITKQALSQYETGKSHPRLNTLIELARALSVTTADLLAPPSLSIELVAYRRKSGMPKGEEERLHSYVTLELEKRVRLQEIIKPRLKGSFPIHTYPVSSLEDAENAASDLRSAMGLGLAPVGNVIDILAAHGLHVCRMESGKRFEGVSAVVKKDQSIVAGGIVTRLGVCGERQRLTICHEAGHLYLRINGEVDEEKAAYRFAGAFLMPSKTVFADVGMTRRSLHIDEMLTLKKRYGVSIAALVTRLRDLEIITPEYHKRCFITLSKRGWRIAEPEPLAEEEPLWLRQNALRARAQGLLTAQEVFEMLGVDRPPAMSIQLSLFDDQTFSTEQKGNPPGLNLTLFDDL
jgi:transcriptional regulator with XRE-family HTH domain